MSLDRRLKNLEQKTPGNPIDDCPCQTCFDAGAIFLTGEGTPDWWVCPACGNDPLYIRWTGEVLHEGTKNTSLFYKHRPPEYDHIRTSSGWKWIPRPCP